MLSARKYFQRSDLENMFLTADLVDEVDAQEEVGPGCAARPSTRPRSRPALALCTYLGTRFVGTPAARSCAPRS